MKRINSIHRRAIKLLLPNPNISTDDKFKQLNILPLDKQLFFNKAVITHKIYNDQAPPYLSPLLKKAPQRYGSTKLILPLPRIDLYKSSLSYSGSAIWNMLPDYLKFITSSPKFKKQLRIYLLDVHWVIFVCMIMINVICIIIMITWCVIVNKPTCLSLWAMNF